jgi:hypothetical protein
MRKNKQAGVFFMRDNNVQFITRTAVFIALTIVLQAATAPLGNTLITGSIVNMLLIVSVMTCGLASGLTVAAISPILAKFFAIGPLWEIIPFIMLGNATLVVLWHFLGNRVADHPIMAYGIAMVLAAVAKFAVLYIGIVQIAIPVLLQLPAQQATVISNMFSLSQLFTALVGGAVALAILPVLKKAAAQKSV